MTRDPDLVRAILVAVERLAPVPSFHVAIKGSSAPLVQYHCKLLFDAGYLDGRDTSNLSRFQLQIMGLSWKGHELLDAIREAADWIAIRTALQMDTRAVPFSIVEASALRRAREAAGLPEPSLDPLMQPSVEYTDTEAPIPTT